MVMPKVPKQFCIDEFEYKEFLGESRWGDKYADPVPIEHCRIDRGAEYSTSSSGKQLLFNAVIFCYEGITTPIPDFKTESIIIFDGQEHTITKVIPIYEPYKQTLYSVELEVI